MNKEKNKKTIFIIIGILLVLIGGISYAFFNYTRTGLANVMESSTIIFSASDGDLIDVSGDFPQGVDLTNEEEVALKSTHSGSLSITSNTDISDGIKYTIYAIHGDDITGKTRFDDSSIKFQLEPDFTSGEDGFTVLTNNYSEPTNLSFTDGKAIISTGLVKDTEALTTVNYNFSMWLDASGMHVSSTMKRAILAEGNPSLADTTSGNTTAARYMKNNGVLTNNVTLFPAPSSESGKIIYTTNEFSNGYYNIKIVVEAEDSGKIFNSEIVKLASTTNYVASYDDIIEENPTFTTQDQVSTNATKQTVYYYTGNDAAANANVMFAGYCWQIVRTTDNGGIRMIYNGVAQKTVTLTTETIADSGITYTNDGTYAYTYDSTTKKWTSTNHTNNATGTFIFTVKEADDYIINYVVSSEANSDKVKIYKNNTQIKEDSGIKEDSIDLGALASTDEIKVEYTKDSSASNGNDNVIFEITKITNRIESENLECSPTRTATKGINQTSDGTTQSMTGASLYGRSFDYDLATGEFTLQETNNLPTAWTTSDNNSNGIADYKELIGTYTCLSNSATCSMLYYVGSYSSNTTAYVSKYTTGDVAHYSQMGTSAFNPNYGNPAMVGYMFNTEYDYKYGSKAGAYYTTAVWENNAYTLSNSNNETAPDATHHYICDTDCTKVRYYYYVSGSSYDYILLENGMTIEDAIYQMTGYGTTVTKNKAINANYELNNYNSSMKGYLDNWYKKNLTGYTSYLDSTSVYCNDRSIRELGGWNPTTGTSLTTMLQFYQYNANRDLNCANETDRFAVTNTKAELTYPIGILTEPERNLMTANYAKTSQYYWGGSPYNFNIYNARVRYVYTTGDYSSNYVDDSYGARGVVTLKHGTMIEKGSGTYTDPYIVGPIVERDTNGNIVQTTTPTATATPAPVVPTIASCQGCKFVYTTNTYYYSGTPSTTATFASNNDALVDDYTTLNKNRFLGFKFDGSGNITNAYACGIKGTDYLNDEEQTPGVNAGTAFCVEGSTDGSTYSATNTFLNDSTTGIWQGRCDDDGFSVFCGGSVYAYASNGDVNVGGAFFSCNVYNDGRAICA